MSVVVYRGGVLAADSQSTRAGARFKDPKLFIVREGVCAVGVVGPYGLGMRFVEWLRADRAPALRPNFTKEEVEKFDALLLYPDGRVESWEGDVIGYPMSEEFYAIGAGADIALGALHRGATAMEAVDIACRVNVFCGPPIVAVRAEEGRLVYVDKINA